MSNLLFWILLWTRDRGFPRVIDPDSRLICFFFSFLSQRLASGVRKKKSPNFSSSPRLELTTPLLSSTTTIALVRSWHCSLLWFSSYDVVDIDINLFSSYGTNEAQGRDNRSKTRIVVD
jgi:hypothetical protein